MERKGHGTIKKSKAYGTIGTLLLSGVALATLSVGTTSVSADETVVETHQVDQLTTDNLQHLDQTVIDDNESTSAELPTPSPEEELSNSNGQSSNASEGSETEEHQHLTEESKQPDDLGEADTESVEKNDTVETDIPLDTPKTDDLDSNMKTEEEGNSSQKEDSVDENGNQEVEDSSNQNQVDTTETPDKDSAGATGSATQEVTSVTLGSNGFQIQYNQAISAGSKIMFAVWSQVNGQDDLIWYTADSTGKVVAKYTGSYGTYYVHTYQNVNGKMIGLNGTSIDIPKPSATVSVKQQTETTYQVTVDNVPAYITSIVLPTWTEANGQDDIIWYQTTKNGTTSYTAIISVAKHYLESGKYNVHVYGTSAVTNALVGLTGTTFTNDYQFGDVTVDATLGQNGIVLTMPSDVAQGLTVQHAVWSTTNGQDDLVWYRANASGQTVAKYTGDYGTYLIHTYAVIHGKMVCINATSIEVPKPQVNATITKESPTTYKVTVTGVPVYIDSVQVPTWTEANGQDDIQWYTATKASDGSYYVIFSEATHNLEAGKYNVHVYGHSNVTNSLIGLLGTSVTSDYHFGDVTVNATLGQNGIVLTMPSDVAQGLTVQHAVWSTTNGQDDLVWYRANTSGQTVAKYTGDYGTYLIHTYAVIHGQMVCINATSIEVPKPKVTVTLEKVSDTSAKVTVTNVPVYITGISLPIWTEANGQDDIKWYSATKQADGSYSYTFYAKDHGFESGHYNVHVYGHSNVTNSFVGLSGSNGIDLIFNQSLTKPTVTVQNHNSTQGTLQVVISETETSKNIGSVQVAAWSDAEQKNLHWYGSSSIVNGKVVITVDEKYHHNITGDYTVHVYVKTTDGEVIGYNLGTYAFNNTQTTSATTTTYKGTGVYGITVSGVYSNGTIKYAVWSDTNGQDDIRWYDATTVGTTAIGLLNVANHSGTGTYHIHVYQSDNGKMFFLNSTSFTVKRTNYDTPYYNQRDPRWGNTHYGYYTMSSTGCAPTALSMVFSALTGTTVLPTDVATYLYNETVEFNRGSEGTTGRGVLMASNKWQFSATVLSSSNSLAAVLQESHHVVAAVQQNKFSPWGRGTSHEIVLKGYSNGMTYVLDPYNSANNGWYPIEALWNEQSTQYGDIAGLGAPFVKITDV